MAPIGAMTTLSISSTSGNASDSGTTGNGGTTGDGGAWAFNNTQGPLIMEFFHELWRNY